MVMLRVLDPKQSSSPELGHPFLMAGKEVRTADRASFCKPVLRSGKMQDGTGRLILLTEKGPAERRQLGCLVEE